MMWFSYTLYFSTVSGEKNWALRLSSQSERSHSTNVVTVAGLLQRLFTVSNSLEGNSIKGTPISSFTEVGSRTAIRSRSCDASPTRIESVLALGLLWSVVPPVHLVPEWVTVTQLSSVMVFCLFGGMMATLS